MTWGNPIDAPEADDALQQLAGPHHANTHETPHRTHTRTGLAPRPRLGGLASPLFKQRYRESVYCPAPGLEMACALRLEMHMDF